MAKFLGHGDVEELLLVERQLLPLYLLALFGHLAGQPHIGFPVDTVLCQPFIVFTFNRKLQGKEGFLRGRFRRIGRCNMERIREKFF